MAAKIPGNGVESSGAFTVGAAGTASNLAGIPFYKNDTGSVYTHDVSGTDSTANYNTAYGINALDAITTGDNNTVMGSAAGGAITEGHRNVFVGQGAGLAITTGTHTVAIGNAAASGYDTETNNIAIGHVALGGSVAGGEYNVAIGNYSLDALTSGDHCTAVGYNAGTNNTTGIRNVFIGSNAGTTNTTGEENISIGYTTTMGGSGENRSVTIGNEVQGNTDYTTIGYGSNDIRTAHGNTGWATVSDERYKKDIADSTAGLSFINDLKPRTFKYKNLGDLPNTFNAYKENSTDVYKNSKTNHGFIAQEVKAVIDSHSEIKDGFRMWDDRPDGSQEISETPLLPILVKAVQELSAQVTTLQNEVTTLKGE